MDSKRGVKIEANKFLKLIKEDEETAAVVNEFPDEFIKTQYVCYRETISNIRSKCYMTEFDMAGMVTLAYLQGCKDNSSISGRKNN